VYLDYLSAHVYHEALLINLGAPFHTILPKKWFFEYERDIVRNNFLGDDSIDKIIGHGKFKLKLMGGRIRTHLNVFHIPILEKNLISIRNLINPAMKTMFENDTYKMVQEL